MSNKSRAELYRLKMKMEIIRTVCPIIMIIIQLLIVIEIFQARIMPTFVPRGTYLKIWKICFFQIFGAGAPVVSQRLFLHGPQKRVTNLPAIGRVFYLTIGAAAPKCENEVVFKWCCSRRLQYSTDAMSSLFCDPDQLNAVWSSLAQSAKISADCTKSTSTLSSTF